MGYCTTTCFFLAALGIRLAILPIAEHMDRQSLTNKYTDVDYEVFSDAATHVRNNASPYDRHTYRYTPIAAYICLVNNFIHPQACKVVFILFDMLMGIVYWRLVKSQLPNAISTTCSTMGYVACWLFNPLIIQTTTRGSNDSIISFLVFFSVYLLLKRQYCLAGIFYGLSVHFKLYPIFYCYVLYFFIDCDRGLLAQGKPIQAIVGYKGFFTRNRLVFTLSMVFTFCGLAALFYQIYGYTFLYEWLLYHGIRKDNRHNNSVYFYLIY